PASRSRDSRNARRCGARSRQPRGGVAALPATGLVCRVPAARRAWPDGAASARSRVGGRLLALLRFDLGRLLFHHLDEVIDDALILEAVVRHAGNIDLMRIVAATGETDIGFARLAR